MFSAPRLRAVARVFRPFSTVMGSSWLDHDLLWKPSHRRALIALLTVLLLCLSVKLAFNRTRIPDPQPEAGLRSNELATQIDPNTATWEELAAIPRLGEKRAQAIVALRDQLLGDHPDHPPFSKLDDLRQVKGIGPSTIANLKPYLFFAPATRPATAH